MHIRHQQILYKSNKTLPCYSTAENVNTLILLIMIQILCTLVVYRIEHDIKSYWHTKECTQNQSEEACAQNYKNWRMIAARHQSIIQMWMKLNFKLSHHQQPQLICSTIPTSICQSLYTRNYLGYLVSNEHQFCHEAPNWQCTRNPIVAKPEPNT